MLRTFLGWEKSLVESAAEWLWARRDSMASMCLVVPTAQAGRRLQEAVAQIAARDQAAVLGLRTVTPAYFIKATDSDIADESIELVAWMEVLEAIDDWSTLSAAFPHALDEEEAPGWSRSLAQSLVTLRYQLQENGLLLRDAALRMGQHHDAARWKVLAMLELRVEALLREWKLRSRSIFLQQRHAESILTPLPNDCHQLVIVGVTETSPFVVQQWRRSLNVQVLIAAPPEEAEHFDDLGFPRLSWCERRLGFPGRNGIAGNVHLVGDIRQLAEQAVACVARTQAASDQVMLATCEPALGHPLATAFARAGWHVFDPASESSSLDWRVWLRHWQRWMSLSSLSVVAEMAGFRETQCLTGGSTYGWLKSLGILRDQCLVDSFDDIKRLVATQSLPRGLSEDQAQQLLVAVQQLHDWRAEFLKNGFCTTMEKLLERWQQDTLIDTNASEWFARILALWGPWEKQLSRDATFWLQLCCERLPAVSVDLPDERALDVEGWLEIPFHKSTHLLICGMDDHVVPARCGGEPWLTITNREWLGLNTDAQREARDAYLYHALLESHRAYGTIDILCSKTDTQGKILRPSRLLLRAGGEELAHRVAQLFAEVPPADAQLHWHPDWKWQPRKTEVAPEKEGIRKLSVTALRDYIACPYRFYLKHGLKMNQCDGDRGEWNHRDFGNLLHEVLEMWGLDPSARDLTSATALTQYWHAQLAALIERRYGSRPNLALQLQTAALRQRLEWFADIQAQRRAEGWQVWKVETPFTLLMPPITLRGKIDRIDYHPATDAYMMWDYKSGRLDDKVKAAHLKKLSAKTTIPSHLANDERLLVTDENGKQQRWINLQLPLYSAAGLTPNAPGVGYICLGDARDKVFFDPWEDFDANITQAARDCAEMLIERMAADVFWPPNEKVVYDDFDLLSAGSDLAAMTIEPWSLET